MSETLAIPSSPTTPPSPTANNGKKFEGEGLAFKGKLIGMEDLNIDRDEKVCLESMFKLKAVAKARGEHKQKVQLNLTMNSVKVTDELTKTLVANHEIERISFVVLDPRDNRAFGYVYNTSDDRHQFWAIKTERAAAATVLALKELFEHAFDVYTKAGGIKPSVPTETPLAAPLTSVPEPTPSVVVPPPEPALVVPPPQPFPSLFDDDFGQKTVPVANLAPLVTSEVPSIIEWDEPIAPVAPVKQEKPKEDFDDLFNLLGPTTTSSTAAPTVTSFPGFFDTPISTVPTFPPAPSIFAPMPAPVPTPVASTNSLLVNNLPTSPVSPIAPPTVNNPMFDLDFFGSSTAKTTKDAFFNNAPPKQSIAQLQNERSA